MSHPPRLMHLTSLTVLAALTAAVLAACGGASKPSGTGTSGSPPEAFVTSKAYKYPTCMRNHGVTKFPDPRLDGGSAQIQITPAIVGSPAFRSAQKACAYLLPAGAGQVDGPSPEQQQARTDGLVAFAGCMRRHGFPGFPDPTSQGRLTIAMITQAGINLRQPAVLQAGDACVSVSHGQITRSDVTQAVVNPSASGSRSSASG